MSAERRRISILGCTGSVGRNAVELAARDPGQFRVDILVANRDHRRLAEQARLLRPELVVVADEAAYEPLCSALSGSGIEVAAGAHAVLEAARRPVDCVIAAIVGAAGLAPAIAAVRTGAVIGIANKEALVCAGDLLTEEARASGAILVPVDSEHSAIFQLLQGDRLDAVDKIVLTASGGPFRTWSRAAMRAATPDEALAHPNWKMGAKISVDSATMVNKGLEIIEAHHLFGLPDERIEILVHPQSIVHGMVEYADGSLLAQMGSPDMRIPISYAMAWPRRMQDPGSRLDLAQVRSLSFEPVDEERFPGPRLARQVLRAGGTAPTIFNAANEVAVQSFLDRAISFLDITSVVAETVERLGGGVAGDLEDVLAWDQKGRRAARDVIAVTAR